MCAGAPRVPTGVPVGAPAGPVPTHLPFLQQSAQRALPDDVAPAQEEANPECHHHHQEEAAHDPGGDGGDLGPGMRCTHKRVRCAGRWHGLGIRSSPACCHAVTSFKMTPGGGIVAGLLLKEHRRPTGRGLCSGVRPAPPRLSPQCVAFSKPRHYLDLSMGWLYFHLSIKKIRPLQKVTQTKVMLSMWICMFPQSISRHRKHSTPGREIWAVSWPGWGKGPSQ